jgi:hypothetical protein
MGRMRGNIDGGLRQSAPGGQQLRARQVRGKVAVADIEPRWRAQAPHGFHALEAVALHAPAPILAQPAGQHVQDGIEVRGNMQAPPLQVVTRVNDDREFAGGHQSLEPVHKLGAPSAAGKHYDHAALRA